MENKLVIKIAYTINSLVRLIPNFLTDKFPPSMMGKAYLEKAKTNPYGIPANRTSQAVCAKYCGNCPSNPFTNGGLYCISGKSKKKVGEKGCNCFDCEIFDQCGGSKGYFCKFGSAKEVGNPIPEKAADDLKVDETEDSSSKKNNFEISYDRTFIDALMKEDEEKKEQMQILDENEVEKNKTINVSYDGEEKTFSSTSDKTILEISKENGISHVHACGGKAKCSTCRVLVLSELSGLQKRNEKEQKLAKRKNFASNIRLSCQTKLKSDVVIRRLVVDEKQTDDAIGEGRFYPGPFGLDKTVTILFLDIRNFTKFSENSLPYDVVHILNSYFETICSPIDKYNGYIDKYMGDGVMAIFGITNSNDKGEKSAEDAMNASFEIMERLSFFNQEFQKKYGQQFRIGIGLHCGEVVLAKIGFKKKRQFTAIGDAVNTASRIEASTKEHNTSILVSHNIYKATKDKYVWGREISQRVKGKAEALMLYEPLKRRELSQ